MTSRILGGLFIAMVGAGITIYTETIMTTFGSMDWADRWMSLYGGSRLAYKLAGISFVVIGFMMMTGMLGPILLSLLGRLFVDLRPIAPK